MAPCELWADTSPPRHRYGGWTGALCDAPDCPGTPACGDFRGECYIADTTLPLRQQFPECKCHGKFSGNDCSAFDSSVYDDVTVERKPNTSTVVTNTLDIGAKRTYFFSVDAQDGVLVQLFSESPGADAILLGRPDTEPSITLGTPNVFDEPAWIQHKLNHTLSEVMTSSGEYFVTVLNGRYATEPLTYTLSFERHTDCSGALQDCNGHGTCDVNCKCDDGYEGVRCELPVPTLPINGPTVHRTVDVGEWAYFLYQPGTNATEVEFKLTGTNIHKKSFPLLIVGPAVQRRSNNLRLVTKPDTGLLFDYDGYTSPIKDQTLVVRKKGAAINFFFIGVHNTRNSWQPVQVALTVTERTTSAFDASGCSASAAAAESCSNTLCHGRGSVITDNDGYPSCSCEVGWKAATFCGAPFFESFVNLLSTAQDVGFLCNLCDFDISLERNTMRLYSIPQPLQRLTGLSIVAKSANASVRGNPSLLVSEYLPRSIADFRFVASSSSPNETLIIHDQSPTGRYWLLVYANVAGDYSITASREATPGEPLFTETFFEGLVDWVQTTTIGLVTAIVAGSLIVCLCVGCCLQIRGSGGVRKAAHDLNRAVSQVGTSVSWAACACAFVCVCMCVVACRHAYACVAMCTCARVSAHAHRSAHVLHTALTVPDFRGSSRRLAGRNARPRGDQSSRASQALSLQLAAIAQQHAEARRASPAAPPQPRGRVPPQHIRSPQPTAPRRAVPPPRRPAGSPSSPSVPLVQHPYPPQHQVQQRGGGGYPQQAGGSPGYPQHSPGRPGYPQQSPYPQQRVPPR